jgi:hypothetical protein
VRDNLEELIGKKLVESEATLQPEQFHIQAWFAQQVQQRKAGTTFPLCGFRHA